MNEVEIEQIRQKLLRLRSELQQLEKTFHETSAPIELDQARGLVGYRAWMPCRRNKWRWKQQDGVNKSFWRSMVPYVALNQASMVTALYVTKRLIFADFPSTQRIHAA